MTLVSDFEASLDDLDKILSDLERLEKEMQPGGNLHQQLAAISVVRSSTYIVAYSAIERAFRSALLVIRSALSAEKTAYHQVEKYWRLEALEHCLNDLLKQGSAHQNFYDRIDKLFAPNGRDPVWTSSAEGLPFSGNINHERIHLFCKQLGIKLGAPKSARGGVDLESIRRNRNNLAHGNEKFSDVGTQVTISDLRETYHRARIFMRAVLRALEKYKDKRKYLQPKGTSATTAQTL